ncbi:CHAD domain-containing protein [Paraburkholderia sacchari]|uniref:CHAD domain-containing protein n=1 Tax=Paraburkholderia sacchari TaxID=159450 RepID=UPI000541C5F7|nr:CHAD domain-containing protein [Paraburkholderia sacchari]NLP64717.1 CHAD domain-containing protein [Paraburkholderia sacchari]
MSNDQHELREACAETSFPAIASPLVNQAIEQARTVASDPSAEGLHQLRITMRRLRSLWWAYRPLLDAGENTSQRELFRSLADTAGRTRDYDILIELLKLQREDWKALPPEILEARQKALDVGREVFSNPATKTQLLGVLSQTSDELVARQDRQPLQAFSDERVAISESQLRRRMRRASKAKRSNFAAFHDVRKAGKKARYLLELFGPVLSRGHRKTLNELKEVQKRFGALNDVVASENLLRDNAPLLAATGEPERTLKWFKQERERRLRAVAALIRKQWK